MDTILLEKLTETAHKVGDKAACQAVQIDENRRVSDELIADMLDGQLVSILQPKRFGGLELGMPEFTRVAQILASYNVSMGWVQCLIGCHHWWGALTEPQFQEELWGDNPHRMFADVFAPVGKVEKVSEGFLLSGEWKFASGVYWSDYVALGGMAQLEPGEDPVNMMFFLPKGDFEIMDDWYTLGLRGTGSCGIRVNNAMVPTYRTIRMDTLFAGSKPPPGLAYNPGPLYHQPFSAVMALAIALPSLGGVTGMISRFRERIQTRVPLFTDQKQNEMVTSQVLLAECKVRVDAIEQLCYRYADELTIIGEKAVANEPYDVAEFRMRATGWRVHLGREARNVGELLFEHSGAFAVYEGDDMQRAWRDLYTMAQHIGIQHETGLLNYGRYLAGLAPTKSGMY
ncbi:MAG: hypothetical protein KUG75_12960 [Pseudomonadales bacterium]|nr:hypothetical protein [Pseudomonadales bacterium]